MRTVIYEKKPRIVSAHSVVGKKEAQGDLKEYFDSVITSERIEKKSWEKTESEMQSLAVSSLISKSGLKYDDIELIVGGDLLNQCTGTSFGLMKYNIPFFGIYGACSTFCEGLCISSMIVSGGFKNRVITVSSSHFCSSERQFRFPLEYGGQRPPTSQWTVTGAGAALVSDGGSDIAITAITPGKVVDMGIKDANNMGAAMAPAAVDTIKTHFKDRNLKSDYFDMVITGDLGKIGYEIAKEQLAKDKIDLKDRYHDCGVMIYNSSQDVHSGGSGCGCCASVFSGYVMKLFKQKKINKILLTATGALMSPTSSFQGESIPSVAHAVAIERI